MWRTPSAPTIVYKTSVYGAGPLRQLPEHVSRHQHDNRGHAPGEPQSWQERGLHLFPEGCMKSDYGGTSFLCIKPIKPRRTEGPVAVGAE
ncbi:hypothetical protein Ssi02_28130 [Sinosporangium siamense]|uniref:Uncharacterized protein n=1 Tax=Sinosporangium siamense TaxID=1367973 RepID=A0A919V7X6_9ACTN|nr:hypothetical protein Ssi02_28130 [Sinosporangium siamense]